LCAISLGLVGRASFDRRQGRNQTFNSAGNVVAAVAMGLIGYFISNRGIFFFVIAFTVPRSGAVHDRRRANRLPDCPRRRWRHRTLGADRIVAVGKKPPLAHLLDMRGVFPFANAAMLPLLGEMLAKGRGGHP